MNTKKSTSQTIPQHDYRSALEGALSWLGDRYLLAEPLNRRSDDAKVHVSESQHSQPSSTLKARDYGYVTS
jgi:hypothetical protein